MRCIRWIHFIHHATNRYGNKWDKKAPIDLCAKAFYGMQSVPNEQVVVMNQVLTHESNIGYEEFQNLEVCFCILF